MSNSTFSQILWPVSLAKTSFTSMTLRIGAALLCSTLLASCDSGQRLGESNLDDFARFGRSVDISGFDAVVGAYQESDGAAEGAVYVYSRRDDSWSIQQRLESPNPADEQFGDDVAIYGNVVAVGAPLDHQLGALRSGSVYLFERASDGTWSHFQTLASPLPRQAWEAFGISVALYKNTLVVGAVDRDQGALVDAGAAFVYERSGSNFVLSDTLAALSPVASDKFGSDVDVFEDTVVVSAVRSDESGFDDSGAVFVFEDAGAGFVYTQTLVAADAEDDQLFGTGISLFEFNDGSRRLAVGAEASTIGADASAGAAYVFDALPAGAFSQTIKLSASDSAANDLFGTDVALWNDTIVVGASGGDGNESGSGVAYIFDYDGAVWFETDILIAASSDLNSGMGSAVDMWGPDHVLLGATGEELEANFTDTGVVKAFRRDGGAGWLESHTLSPQTESVVSAFRPLDIDGDYLIATGNVDVDIFRLDTDAYSFEKFIPIQADATDFRAAAIDGMTAAVAGRRLNPAFPIGYVEIMVLDGDDWVQEQLIDPDLVSAAAPLESANSMALSLEADTLILGANRWNGGDGRVFIYERSGDVWSQNQLFTSSQASGNFDMNYGDSVELSGDWLAISEVPSGGVPGSPRSGNVFLYERQPSGDFVEQQVLTETVPAAFDRYGELISLDDDLLAVYSDVADIVYVYKRAAGVYSEVWQLPGASGVEGLFVDQTHLAVSYPNVAVDGKSAVGEVVVYERQPDDSYSLESVYHPYDMRADTRMGYDTELTADHVISRSTSYTYVLPR